MQTFPRLPSLGEKKILQKILMATALKLLGQATWYLPNESGRPVRNPPVPLGNRTKRPPQRAEAAAPLPAPAAGTAPPRLRGESGPRRLRAARGARRSGGRGGGGGAGRDRPVGPRGGAPQCEWRRGGGARGEAAAGQGQEPEPEPGPGRRRWCRCCRRGRGKMVFESLVVDVLNRFLGDYVVNLDSSQLKLGIWGGTGLPRRGGTRRLAGPC